MADVHDVQQQVGLRPTPLFERCLEGSTRPCGNLRMKPTVSVSKTFWFVGSRKAAVVGFERGEQNVLHQNI